MDRHRIRAILRRGLFQPLALALGGLLLFSGYPSAWAQARPDSVRADTSQTWISKRNPWAAFGLSWLLTGMGQFYNHEKTKGTVMLGLYLPFAVWFIVDQKRDPNTGAESYPLIPLAVSTGIKVWSMVDAPLSAKRINRLNGYGLSKAPSLQLGVYPSPRDPKKCQVGLLLKKGF
jgi:hypothetical protein